MRYTWDDIRRLYMNACGQTTAAAQEFFDHATGGSRQLATRIEEKELVETNATITVPADQDYVAWDPDAYAIDSIFNVTTGVRLEPEEEGMRGRTRYLLKDTAKPPTGDIHRYHPEGKKLFFRDTPTVQTTLQVNFKMIPPDVTAEMLEEHPIFPAHMDHPLLYLTIATYYAFHPEHNILPENAGTKSSYYEQLADGTLMKQKPPKQVENRDRREAHRQWGYQMW